MNNITKYSITIIMLIFAFLQYNDPDWYLWMPVYLSIAILYVIQKQANRVYYIFLIIFVIAAIAYIPDIIRWIKDGSPSITGTMKAESPEVELTREFFGLCVCIAAIIYRMRAVK